MGVTHVGYEDVVEENILCEHQNGKKMDLTDFEQQHCWVSTVLLYWDFHKSKYPAISSCVDENAMLTSEVRGLNGQTGWRP